MTLKAKTSIALIVVAISFAAGRYSVPPADTKTESHTVTDETKKIDTDRDIKTVETIVKTPDGRETRTIVTDDKSKIKESAGTKTRADQVSESKSNRQTLNVSLLAGMKLDLSFATPCYGLAVTKQVFGPVTIGVWGLTNNVYGASIGVSF